ncbi:MAG: hypothetical protein ACOYOK_14600, partial [Pseudobdellovibrionaceae bacterium]
SLIEIGSEVWEFRKANGFSKKFPPEIQQKIAQLCASGVTAYALGKATGIQRNRIMEWKNRFSEKSKSDFEEVTVIEGAKPNFEVKLSAKLQGCRVEIIGTDYALLQRLLRKMGS